MEYKTVTFAYLDEVRSSSVVSVRRNLLFNFNKIIIQFLHSSFIGGDDDDEHGLQVRREEVALPVFYCGGIVLGAYIVS